MYAFNEAGRQADAAETIQEVALEDGAHWYLQFECAACHGLDAGGGAAASTEARSGVDTAWQVPSLNDVLFRFDREEIRDIITYGRPGTPMPANGLEGGGAMSMQEVDQVIDYLASLQISQSDVVAKTDGSVSGALSRIEGGAATTTELIAVQQAKIDDVLLASDQLAAAGTLGDEIRELLAGAGTCTEASAAIVKTTCADPAEDSERDGLADSIEPRLTDIAAIAHTTLTQRQGTKQVEKAVYDVAFDPTNAYTNVDDQGRPVPDIDEVTTLLASIEADLLLIRVTANKQDEFLADLDSGMVFLQESATAQVWDVDFTKVSASMSEQSGTEMSEANAERAVGLFNSSCARCHTGGYSAGAPFPIGQGAGAWGPSIADNRTVEQFPSFDDHVDFIIDGTNNAEPYGVNGIGTGRMPGFGTSLSRADIELIALYERTL
ncbi:MAG TPA: c-type cytochrome, partial [Acidimicrobiia bacterium]|nr:c-type cytochrome [Acidimicrobiia bacterium]